MVKMGNIEELLKSIEDTIKSNDNEKKGYYLRNIPNYENYFISKIFTNVKLEIESVRDLGNNLMRVHVKYDYEYYSIDNDRKNETKGYKYCNIKIQENGQEMKIIETDMLNEKSLSIKAFRKAVILVSLVISGLIAYLIVNRILF